jgi:hypothetical protein
VFEGVGVGLGITTMADYSDKLKYRRSPNDYFGELVDKDTGIVVFRQPLPNNKSELEFMSNELTRWLEWYGKLTGRV